MVMSGVGLIQIRLNYNFSMTISDGDVMCGTDPGKVKLQFLYEHL